jgi:hypothetical protein
LALELCPHPREAPLGPPGQGGWIVADFHGSVTNPGAFDLWPLRTWVGRRSGKAVAGHTLASSKIGPRTGAPEVEEDPDESTKGRSSPGLGCRHIATVLTGAHTAPVVEHSCLQGAGVSAHPRVVVSISNHTDAPLTPRERQQRCGQRATAQRLWGAQLGGFCEMPRQASRQTGGSMPGSQTPHTLARVPDTHAPRGKTLQTDKAPRVNLGPPQATHTNRQSTKGQFRASPGHTHKQTEHQGSS